jgi:hypothetical protein
MLILFRRRVPQKAFIIEYHGLDFQGRSLMVVSEGFMVQVNLSLINEVRDKEGLRWRG